MADNIPPVDQLLEVDHMTEAQINREVKLLESRQKLQKLRYQAYGIGSDPDEKRKDASVKDAHVYKGDTYKAYKQHVRDVELARVNAPRTFTNDIELIAWAMQYLGDNAADAWQRVWDQARINDDNEVTLELYKDTIITCLGNLDQRMQGAADEWAKAHQGADERIRIFVQRLEDYEDNMLEKSDHQWILDLRNKVTLSLRIELDRQRVWKHAATMTKPEFISEAEDAEATVTHVNKLEAKKHRGSESLSSRGYGSNERGYRGGNRGRGQSRSGFHPYSRSESNNATPTGSSSSTVATTTDSSNTDRSNMSCWNCNRKGHGTRLCPLPRDQATISKNRDAHYAARMNKTGSNNSRTNPTNPATNSNLTPVTESKKE